MTGGGRPEAGKAPRGRDAHERDAHERDAHERDAHGHVGRRRAAVQLLAAGVSLAAWIAAKPHDVRLAVVALLVAGWGMWAIWRVSKGRPTWAEWGLDRPLRGWRTHLGAAAAGLAVVGLLRAWMGGAETHPPTWAWLAYGAWALAQQFAVQAVVVASSLRVGVPAGLVPPLGGMAFGLGHWPYLSVVVTGAALGLATTALFVRHRNLWLAWAVHGAVGGAFFAFVIGGNPVGFVVRGFG